MDDSQQTGPHQEQQCCRPHRTAAPAFQFAFLFACAIVAAFSLSVAAGSPSSLAVFHDQDGAVVFSPEAGPLPQEGFSEIDVTADGCQIEFDPDVRSGSLIVDIAEDFGAIWRPPAFGPDSEARRYPVRPGHYRVTAKTDGASGDLVIRIVGEEDATAGKPDIAAQPGADNDVAELPCEE